MLKLCLIALVFVTTNMPAQGVPSAGPTGTNSAGSHDSAQQAGIARRGGVRDASSFPGADIGSQVNAAISNLPHGCGEVTIPSGSYRQATTIIKPRCVKLHGEGAFGTTLNWTPNSGAALAVEDTSGLNDYPEGEVADLTLSGPGANTNAMGIYLGGDPPGSTLAVYHNSTLCAQGSSEQGCPPQSVRSGAYADHENINRVRVLHFGTAVQWGVNAWDTTISQTLITNNGVGLSFPAGLQDSGESISVVNTSVQNNKVGLSLLGFADFYFYGSRCDYNTTCGTVNIAHFYGEHFEQASGTILTVSGVSQSMVEIFGGWAQLTGAKGTDAQMFYVDSSLNPLFLLYGTVLHSDHSVTNVVNWHGSGGAAVLAIQGLPYYQPGGKIASLTNATCNFWGCHIEDGQGLLAFSGRNAHLLADGSAAFHSLTLSSSSTPMVRYARYSATLSPVAVGANTCASQSVTVAGVQPLDVIVKILKPSEQGGLALIGGRATAKDTVSLQFCNNSGTSILPAPGKPTPSS